MFTSKRMNLQAIFVIGLLAIGHTATASDVDDLTAMLHEFLDGASANDAAAHDKFWSKDLVYTSSRGTRTNKTEIMEGMQQAADADDSDDSGPGVIYTAEEVEVDVYGSTAVVAFKLVGAPQGEGDVSYYFNTGTFLKRDGAWQVVAWQATIIPEQE